MAIPSGPSSNPSGVVVSPTSPPAAPAASSQKPASPLQQDSLQLSANAREESIDRTSRRRDSLAVSKKWVDIGNGMLKVAAGFTWAGFGCWAAGPALAVFPLYAIGITCGIIGLGIIAANTPRSAN